MNSIMSLFRANNTVANFWMLFAMLSAYGVVASEVGQEVGREALAHVQRSPSAAELLLSQTRIDRFLSVVLSY